MRGATERIAEPIHNVSISIHAPHAGRDLLFVLPVLFGSFQSTRPMRGATPLLFNLIKKQLYFNPRAPCGARRTNIENTAAKTIFQSTRPMRGATRNTARTYSRTYISIHAPHAGRDSKSEQIALHIFVKKAWIPDIFAQNAAFQSVLPLADRQKLLYLRCEPLRKFLRAFASHYKIIGSSGR